MLFPKQTFFFSGEIKRVKDASCRDAVVVKPATVLRGRTCLSQRCSKGYIFTTNTDRQTDGETAGAITRADYNCPDIESLVDSFYCLFFLFY